MPFPLLQPALASAIGQSNSLAIKSVLIGGAVFGVALVLTAWLERNERKVLARNDEERARSDPRHRAPKPEWQRRVERWWLGDRAA